MASQPFKWCFIGTGTLARQVAREITASGRHQIASVVSRKYENAELFANQYGGAAYDDAAAAMEAADAVYVVTPHPSHASYVRQAIELGKPVLCEKPFTVRAKETAELFQLAREKKVYIVEGMWTWFNPVARQVKACLDSGALGDIQDVITVMNNYVITYAPRLSDPMLAGGALLDSGVYPVTYLYRLFGKPVSVRCTGVIENGVDVSDEIDLTFEDGQTRHISLSIVEKNGGESVRIIGSKADLFIDHFHYADHADLTGKDGKLVRTLEGKTTMLNEFDLVSGEIRAGLKESAYVPPCCTMDVMEILDECLRQINLVYPFE